MGYQIRWWTLVGGFSLLIAGSLGCATMMAVDSTRGNNYIPKPVLQDEIVAIGQPDETLAKKLGQPDVIAFLGRKNTYMLYKGGKELEAISKLELNGRHMSIDSNTNHNLYLKDNKLWGRLSLTYGRGSKVSAEEETILAQANFTRIGKTSVYEKFINIEGLVYPPLPLSDAQMSKLATYRKLSLYDPTDKSPPTSLAQVILVPLAVAVDVVLAPVYLFAGVVMLVALP